MDKQSKHPTKTIEVAQIPPQAFEVEQVVLGQLLIEGNALEIVNGILTQDSFYRESHQKIYLAIKNLNLEGKPINCITVTEYIRSRKELDEIGGVMVIMNLINNVASARTIEYHSLILKQYEIRRQLIKDCYEISNYSYDTSTDIQILHTSVSEVLARIDEQIHSATDNILAKCEVKYTDEIKEVEYLLTMYQNNYSYGLFSRSSTSCVSGGKGTRKSFYIAMITTYISQGLNDSVFASVKSKCIIFDTEQSREYSQKMLHRIAKKTGYLENVWFYNIKEYSINIKMQIIEKALKKHNPDFIVIDNIAHFVKDINDNKESSLLQYFLLKIQAKYNVHTCLVIHRNKADKNLRGVIGTMIETMAECIILIEKDADNKEQSIVEVQKMRGSIAPDNENLTVINDVPCIDRGEKSNNSFVEDKVSKYRFLETKNTDINPNITFESMLDEPPF